MNQNVGSDGNHLTFLLIKLQIFKISFFRQQYRVAFAFKMKSFSRKTESWGAILRRKVNLQSKRLSRFPHCLKTTLLSITENETGVNKIGVKNWLSNHFRIIKMKG